jgi:hypothetical protein
VSTVDMTMHPQMLPPELPDSSQPCMDFTDSIWFKTHGRTREFPTPEHVRSFSMPPRRPHVVRFEDLGLIVKFGRDVSTLEAVNAWAIRRVFQDSVPIPEVYGWRVVEHGEIREVFIYMQLVHGPTLEQQWPVLSFDDKHSICNDLRTIVSRFRNLHDSESEQVIGKLRVK